MYCPLHEAADPWFRVVELEWWPFMSKLSACCQQGMNGYGRGNILSCTKTTSYNKYQFQIQHHAWLILSLFETLSLNLPTLLGIWVWVTGDYMTCFQTYLNKTRSIYMWHLHSSLQCSGMGGSVRISMVGGATVLQHPKNLIYVCVFVFACVYM